MKQGYGRDRTSNKYSDGFSFIPMNNQKCENTGNSSKGFNQCTKNKTPSEKGFKKYTVVIY